MKRSSTWKLSVVLTFTVLAAPVRGQVPDFEECLVRERFAEANEVLHLGRSVEGQALLESLTYHIPDLPEECRQELGETLADSLAHLNDPCWATRARRLARARRVDLPHLIQELDFRMKIAAAKDIFRNGRKMEGTVILRRLIYHLVDLPEDVRGSVGETLARAFETMNDFGWAERAHLLSRVNRMEMAHVLAHFHDIHFSVATAFKPYVRPPPVVVPPPPKETPPVQMAIDPRLISE